MPSTGRLHIGEADVELSDGHLLIPSDEDSRDVRFGLSKNYRRLVPALGAALLLVGAVASWNHFRTVHETTSAAEEKVAIIEGHHHDHGNHSGATEDEPEGCCSWSLPHCGEAKGKCKGGVKACESCKGQWVLPHPGLCDQGHSLENPLPRIWNYTSKTTHKHKVKVLSYNLFWWKLFDKLHGDGGKAGKLIKASVQDEPYDVMGFQECNQPYQVLWDAGMDGLYGAEHTYSNICVAWRKKVWEKLDYGHEIVAQDASWGGPGQNYGQRMAVWVRLRNKETNETLFFMNHHGPLPLSSGGDWGGPTTARKLLEVILKHSVEGEAVIFVGDFNSKLHSLTIQQVACRLNKILSGKVFGGVDHIYTNLGPSAVVSTKILGHGGSDHNAMNAVLELGGGDDADTKE